MTREKSPYERGFADGVERKPGPPFPKGDAPWEQKLYARGWSDGVDAALFAEREFKNAGRAAHVAALGV